jgi:biopolymer transport protein ExbD
MRIGSPISRHKARIEIIPLIDVMFFLLAAFMMVSLTLQRLRTLNLDLPSAVAADKDRVPELIRVEVMQNGDVRLEEQSLSLPDLYDRVRERVESDPMLPVYVQTDALTLHGHVIRVLDVLHATGAKKISMALDVPDRGL